MNLLKLITDRILSFPTHAEAAKHFNTSANNIQKWIGGTGQPTITAAQKILDEEIKAGRLIESSVFQNPASSVKVPEPPTAALTPSQTADLATEAAAPRLAATELSALVAMRPEELELELAGVLDSMPMENRISMLDMLRKGLKRRVAICLPTTGMLNAEAFHSISALTNDLRYAGMLKKKASLIHHARNYLADVFLKSDYEWSLWLDTDMIVPCGKAGYFSAITGTKYDPKFAGMNTLRRLTGHKDKTLVGGVYVQRTAARKFAMQLTDEKLVARLKGGPFDELVPVPWVGTGIAAIHRSVFESIREQMPHLQSPNAPFSFFSMVDGETTEIGEDKLFCKRAAACGHQAYLDCAVFAGHIGNTCFVP